MYLVVVIFLQNFFMSSRFSLVIDSWTKSLLFHKRDACVKKCECKCTSSWMDIEVLYKCEKLSCVGSVSIFHKKCLSLHSSKHSGTRTRNVPSWLRRVSTPFSSAEHCWVDVGCSNYLCRSGASYPKRVSRLPTHLQDVQNVCFLFCFQFLSLIFASVFSFCRRFVYYVGLRIL